MGTNPLVSVIVPNFNHAKFLRDRFNSILNQTFQDFELIILDDCSTDDSRKILESFKNNSKVSHLELSLSNSGSPFKQWAKGVNLAIGDYIWIAESDDYCDKEFLQILIQKLLQYKDLKIAYSGINWVDENGATLRDLSVNNSSYLRNGDIELKNRISLFNSIQNVSAVVFERATLLNFISRIENYKYCGDWILYAYILSTECKILFESQKLTSYRYYHNNLSHNDYFFSKCIVEGVDVLGIVKDNNNLSDFKRQFILRHWLKKVVSNYHCLTIKDYVDINIKLFKFSPFTYLYHFLRIWRIW